LALFVFKLMILLSLETSDAESHGQMIGNK